jgi:hypothetical protein
MVEQELLISFRGVLGRRKNVRTIEMCFLVQFFGAFGRRARQNYQSSLHIMKVNVELDTLPGFFVVSHSKCF